jgi:CBS domain-containing protein
LLRSSFPSARIPLPSKEIPGVRAGIPIAPLIDSRVARSKRGKTMKDLTAQDVMNRQVLSVDPDMTVHELAVFLTENQITGAPVIDRAGRLLGVVSLTDIAESEMERTELRTDRSDPEDDVRGWEEEASSDELRGLHVESGGGLVRDIMTPTAYTISPDTPVSRLAQTMIAGRIHRLLVVRDHGVVGIVTSLDLLKLLTDDPGTAARPGRSRRTVLVRS